MSNKAIASIKAHQKKRHKAIEVCIESLLNSLDNGSDKDRDNYLSRLETFQKISEVKHIYTPSIKDYLAGARSIVHLAPHVSPSSQLKKALFHKSDREALLSNWQHVSDVLWSAYFSAEYAILNMRKGKK